MITVKELQGNPILVVEFGTGDIEMSRFELTKNKDAWLAFEELDEPREIGKEYIQTGKTFRDIQPDLLFTFSKVESIDSLISMLEGCKKTMKVGPLPDGKKSDQ